MQSTAQLRELAAAAGRVFGWDNNAPQVTHNQLVITADQLKQIRMLRDSAEPTDEEADETSLRRLSTLEGQQELRRAVVREFGSEQNMEPQTLPVPDSSGPDIYEVKVTP